MDTTSSNSNSNSNSNLSLDSKKLEDELKNIMVLLTNSAGNDDAILSILEKFYTDHKDDPETISALLLMKNAYKTSLLHILAYHSGIRSLTFILDNFPNAVSHLNDKNSTGQTPLMLATIFERYNTLEILIQNGALINEQALNGNTALHITIEHSLNPKIVNLLLQNGADLDKRNNENESPKDVAIAVANLLPCNENAIANRDLLVNHQELPL